MKTTMTISIDKDLKKEFFAFSRQIGTNPTNLVNMLMKQTINTREVNFRTNNFIDLEIESFNDEEIKSLNNNKNIQLNMKKLDKLLSNI